MLNGYKNEADPPLIPSKLPDDARALAKEITQ